MRYRPGGRTGRSLSESRRTPLGNDNAVGSGRKCGADNSSKILRILDSVEQHEQTWLTLTVPLTEQILERGRRTRGEECDNALMLMHAGNAIELHAIFKTDRHSGTLGELYDFIETPAVTAATHDYRVE